MPPQPASAPRPPVSTALHHDDAEPLLAAWRAAVAGLQQALDANDPAELAVARRRAGDALARLPRRGRGEPLLAEVAMLRERIARLAGPVRPPSSDDLDTARRGLALGWPGWLAAMLRVAAWRLREAPALADVPVWLWGEYTAWLLAAPSPGEPDLAGYSAAFLERLAELDRWVQRNPGSAAVVAAVHAGLRAPLDRSGFASAEAWRRWRETRGRWWARLHGPVRDLFDPVPVPREGRRLRVGILVQRFAPGPGLARLLSRIEQLDTRSFGLELFSIEEPGPAGFAPAGRHAAAGEVLPRDRAGRLALLRKAQLDVLVFAGSLSEALDEVTWLALHRIAPLQVALHAGATTGLPEIDLFADGDIPALEEAGAGFTERLGLMRGPAEVFAFGADGSAGSPASREQLGVPSDATLLVSVATPAGISPGLFPAVADILARCPDARWLLGLTTDGESSEALGECCRRIEEVMTQAGVDSARVVVLPVGDSTGEVRPLLAAADVYLDLGGAEAMAWLALALTTGRPAAAAPRADAVDSARVHGMLEAIGAADLQAMDAAGYAKIATRLARDGAERAARTRDLEARLACGPGFLDSLAASDAFGALIETAFDELTSLGRTEFRLQRDPLRCFGIDNLAECVAAGLEAQQRGDTEAAAFESLLALRSSPQDHRARHLRGVVLHAQNEPSRAVDYLVASVQNPAAGPEVWLDLARVFRDRGQLAEAIRSLEVCVRIDPQPVEALLMLREFSELTGDGDSSADIVQHLRSVAPDDPRVLALG